MLNRREFLRAMEACMALAAVGGFSATAQAEAIPDDVLFAEPQPFPEDFVTNLARSLSEKPFGESKVKLPEALSKLTYDQYRDIRFRADQSLWKDQPPGFPFEHFDLLELILPDGDEDLWNDDYADLVELA